MKKNVIASLFSLVSAFSATASASIIFPEFDFKEGTYECTQSQKDTLNENRHHLWLMSNAMTQRFGMFNSTSKYQNNTEFLKYFDSPDVDGISLFQYHNQVKDVYSFIKATVWKQISYQNTFTGQDWDHNYEIACDPNGTEIASAGVIDHYIYMHPQFWTTLAVQSDKPFYTGGILIHEIAHMYGTGLQIRDHSYGEANAQILAKTDPDKAVTNADNYQNAAWHFWYFN